MLRRAWPLLPLPVLFALAAWLSHAVAERAGTIASRVLERVAAVLVAAGGDAGSEAAETPALNEPAPVELVPVSVPARPGEKPPAKRARTKPSQAATRAVFVSARTVLRLADARAVPHGTAVPASGGRPAGLRLSGVGALGVGLRDGDVLTRAVGQPALSSAAVVRAVLVARSQRAPVLEGEFWRGPERWLLRVEQPYPPES